jgi:hypothetical protein
MEEINFLQRFRKYLEESLIKSSFSKKNNRVGGSTHTFAFLMASLILAQKAASDALVSNKSFQNAFIHQSFQSSTISVQTL